MDSTSAPLSKDQIAFLSWLREQPEPVSLAQMSQANAPGFSRQRVEQLRRSGHINRGMGANVRGELVGVYTIGDRGCAALESLEKIEQDLHEQAARQQASKRADRRFQLLNSLFSAVIGGAVALLVEHFDAVLDVLRSLFQ